MSVCPLVWVSSSLRRMIQELPSAPPCPPGAGPSEQIYTQVFGGELDIRRPSAPCRKWAELRGSPAPPVCRPPAQLGLARRGDCHLQGSGWAPGDSRPPGWEPVPSHNLGWGD